MHLALSIPEILSLIFKHFDNKRNLYRYSQICHAWFIPAIELLWEEIADVKPLFRILAPLRFSEEGWVRKSTAYP